MKRICNTSTMKSHFGKQYELAVKTMTEDYPFLIIDNEDVIFQLDLEKIFTEPMELFSVDPSMVCDMFTITDMFSYEIDPVLHMATVDWLEDLMGQDFVTVTGEFCLTFQDVKEYYGNNFEKEMKRLFGSQYESFESYFSE